MIPSIIFTNVGFWHLRYVPWKDITRVIIVLLIFYLFTFETCKNYDVSTLDFFDILLFRLPSFSTNNFLQFRLLRYPTVSTNDFFHFRLFRPQTFSTSDYSDFWLFRLMTFSALDYLNFFYLLLVRLTISSSSNFFDLRLFDCRLFFIPTFTTFFDIFDFQLNFFPSQILFFRSFLDFCHFDLPKFCLIHGSTTIPI